MVRNLMMIMGLSLAVAAMGGSSDSNNTGGSGGSTGGTGGDGGAGGTAGTGGGAGGTGGATGGTGGSGLPTDACLNEDDLLLVCDEGWSDEVGTCARGASGDPVETAACLVEDTGVSAACASCYGASVGCILVNCIGECGVAPDSQECADCQVENGCDVLQDDCTGDLETGCAG
jgi:hypothetical protein